MIQYQTKFYFLYYLTKSVSTIFQKKWLIEKCQSGLNPGKYQLVVKI